MKEILLIFLVLLGLASASKLSELDQRLLSSAIRGTKFAETHGYQCSIALNAFGTNAAQVFLRMDHAPVSTIELAILRSLTAKEFNMPTQKLNSLSGPQSRFFDVEVVGDEFYTSGPGGLPLFPDFQGSVGVACQFSSDDSIAVGPEKVAQFIKEDLYSSDHNIITEEGIFQSKELQIGSVISLGDALNISLSVLEEVSAAVSVVDAGGNLKFQFSPESISPAFIKASFSKARSTRLFDLEKSDPLSEATQPGSPAYGLQITNGGLFVMDGGRSIFTNKHSIGNGQQIIGSIAAEGPEIEVGVYTNATDAALHKFYQHRGLYEDMTLRERRGITVSEAQSAIRRAIEIRKSLRTPSTPGVYCVRDVNGYIRAFYSEDGVEKGAPDIALKSSKAASLFQIDSLALGKYTRPLNPLYNVELLFGGLVTFESAAVIRDSSGKIIGSIGVSGTGAGRGTANDGYIAKEVSKYVQLKVVDACVQSIDKCFQIIDPVSRKDMNSNSPYPDESIGLGQASALIHSVVDFCLATNQSACISVYDAGAQLKAQLCMDDAFLGATDLTSRKAKTAHLFGKNNGDLQIAQLPNSILYKVELTNGGLFMNPGGVPLKDSLNNHVVGAVGVAGAEDDSIAADPALKEWETRLRSSVIA